jgi:NAD(P)-dependent dehydrogenase (short-subunit alcohol dehydrogenase family)
MHAQQQFINKVVLVTAAAVGIGESAAVASAAQGAKVIFA